jgi:hypothetical protein
MMTIEDVERRQAELLEKVKILFADEKRTKKDMMLLHAEIEAFEKEKGQILYRELYENQ